MNRREFLKNCARTTAAGFLLSNRSMNLNLAGRPNVLYVLADQWRFCAMSHGENNDAVVQTPNLDKILDQGVRWSRCYSAHPVCTANRSATITGRWPHENGMITNSLMMPPEERCIGHVFDEAGYRTHYIGKWHMDGEDKPGFVPKGWRRRGYQTFIGFNRGHFYYDTPTFSDNGVPIGTPGEYEPTFQTDLAIDFMTENKDKPFYCFLSWGPPHTPYSPPPGFDNYDPADIVFRPNVINGDATKLANYFGLCASLDHEFGRLMDTLKQLGIEDNTLVVFTADHGDCIQSHNIEHKGQPEEESCHIPLLMRLPGQLKDGSVVPNLVSTADLMPTVLSMCGLDVPDTCSGKDKSAVALKARSMADESIYSGTGQGWRMVLKGKYKFVVEGIEEVQTPTKLFDLEADPYELDNLIDQPAHAATQADLLAELNAWKIKTDDAFPLTGKKAEIMYDV